MAPLAASKCLFIHRCIVRTVFDDLLNAFYFFVLDFCRDAAAGVQPAEVVRRCRVRAKQGEAEALRQQLSKVGVSRCSDAAPLFSPAFD